MRIVPAIDLDRGRSRIVYWPGAATGVGAPTDQPARIARAFVDRGASLIHLVDFDGARAGAPTNPGQAPVAERADAHAVEAVVAMQEGE